MTLGELRSRLAECDLAYPVRINFGSPTLPVSIESWRGDYSEAAITFGPSSISEGEIDVSGMIALIDEAYGRVHFGYKGGEYRFGPETRVWIAEHGWSGECGVGSVIDKGYVVILDPEYQAY